MKVKCQTLEQVRHFHHSIIRPVRWAELAVLAMYCRFGYHTVRLIELLGKKNSQNRLSIVYKSHSIL